MSEVTEHRWNRLCRSLSIKTDCNYEFELLQQAYSETHRSYHSLQHLEECLAKLDWAGRFYDQSALALVEMALWFHDAIYQPLASNNELKSAEWAVRFLSQAGVDPSISDRVYTLIMATRHGEIPIDRLDQLIVDIDLGILGAESSRFDEYDKQVRKEYRFVPWFLYRKKRKVLLQSFLDRPRIYMTDLFFDDFEENARKNLVNAIQKLA